MECGKGEGVNGGGKFGQKMENLGIYYFIFFATLLWLV